MIKNIRAFFSTEKRDDSVATGNLTETDDFWYGFAGVGASSGAVVTQASAMRQWAVYSCVSLISETLAQLPLKLKRPDDKGGTEDATDHPLYTLCKDLPNNQMPSFNWRESQQANVLTRGNCYNLIDRGRYDVRGLWPIDPDSVTVRMARGPDVAQLRLSKNDRIVYDIKTAEGQKTYRSSDILHVAGFGFNGLMGESVISNFAKESIGNAIALDVFQGSGMKNGIYPSGTLEHPDTLGESKDLFLAALNARYSGATNAKRPMILENGMKFNKADVSFVDKQFIEQMKLTANQICAIFHVPPHKIEIFEKNTNYNNTEQGNKSFLDGTMQSWVVRWEQAMNWKLLTPGERKMGYFFKFNFDALLRPDAKTRTDMAWKEWQMGTPLNKIRKRNDQNPVEGGDKSFVPANMVPIELAGQQGLPNKQAEQDMLKENDLDGVKRMERKAVERLVTRDLKGRCDDFEGELDGIYDKIDDLLNGKTRLIVRCFNDDEQTEAILDDLKAEYREKRNKISELRGMKFKGIEDVWS